MLLGRSSAGVRKNESDAELGRSATPTMDGADFRVSA